MTWAVSPDLETRAADLLAVLDAAGLRRPTLLASADGGMVAALLAATHGSGRGLVWFFAQARSVKTHGWPFGRDPDRGSARSRGGARLGTEDFVRRMYAHAEMDDDVIRFLARCSGMRVVLRPRSGSSGAARLRRPRDPPDAPDPGPGPGDGGVSGSGSSSTRATAALIPGAVCRSLPARRVSTLGATGHRSDVRLLRHPAPASELDSILSTVLFTDIVGSVEKQAEFGDHAWKELVLQYHDRPDDARAVAREGERHGATASTPRSTAPRAIRCALEVAERVRDLGIEIRAGVHTGECELIENKCSGLTVSIGARVAAIGGPGVLVSQTVKDLVPGSGLQFDDAGEHQLKGVPGRWRLQGDRLTHRLCTPPGCRIARQNDPTWDDT